MIEGANEAGEAGETDIDLLSISYLNALEYCPRRFYYECALGEFIDNAHVVEGTMRHERSDSGVKTMEDGVTTLSSEIETPMAGEVGVRGDQWRGKVQHPYRRTRNT